MPLHADARAILQATFKLLAEGERPRVITIGTLTEDQFSAINVKRLAQGLQELESPEIVMLGRHLYNSRVVKDGYSIDDVCDQIESALSSDAMVIATVKMTALRSTTERADRYGNTIKDEAVLELTQRRPKAELFSVIPKGDKNKPKP